MALPLFLTLPIILIILLACYISIQRLKFNLPPGPRPWPIVGNLYQIKSTQCRCFYEWAQIYGPIISVWFGSKLFIVVSNSELAKEVLKENDQELANRLRIKSRLNFARNGMDLTWADYGPHYVKVRKACTLELFTTKKIEAFKPIRKDEVTAMIEFIYNYATTYLATSILDTIIGQERIMTEEDFPSLPYLQAIVKEALRLHPPTPLLLPHRAQTHVKIGGYDVPKDTIVFVNVWALGVTRLFGPTHLSFGPNGSLETDIDIKGHDFRILPFGVGGRVCPGAQLGLNLVTLMLGHLLHHFDWDIPIGTQLESINMSEASGIVTYMASPLQLVPLPKLPRHLYKRICTHI